MSTAPSHSHKSLDVAFRQNVTKEQVHAAIDEIFKSHGCRTCGLVGLDLMLRTERITHPIEEFRNLEGVASVTSIPPR